MSHFLVEHYLSHPREVGRLRPEYQCPLNFLCWTLILKAIGLKSEPLGGN